MMNTTHTTAAKHFRKRLAVAGIKAKCSAYVSCGVQFVRVSPPAYGIEFTDAEQGTILLIAQCNHFTLSQGIEINVDQRTYGPGAVFVLPEGR